MCLTIAALHSQWTNAVHDAVHLANTALRPDDAVDERSVCNARNADERQWRVVSWREWEKCERWLPPVATAAAAPSGVLLVPAPRQFAVRAESAVQIWGNHDQRRRGRGRRWWWS